jgi:uncharacterized membrane protein HdeD (DUF308 family)
MRTLLVTSWWSLVLRGIIAIIAGLVTFVLPGITFAVLVILFGAYALLDGILNIVGAWRAAERHERWVALLLEGFVGIGAAAVTALWPAITALALVIIIAAWALVTGALELAAAVRLRKYITGEWLLALSGIASIIFGLLLAVFPYAGALAIALWIGVYLVIFGVLLVSLGLRLRGLARHLGFAGSPAHAPGR